VVLDLYFVFDFDTDLELDLILDFILDLDTDLELDLVPGFRFQTSVSPLSRTLLICCRTSTTRRAVIYCGSQRRRVHSLYVPLGPLTVSSRLRGY